MSILALIKTHQIMKEGSHGDHVKELQRALRKTGAELVIDGAYGPNTRAAVERFQATSRIAADGMVGPITATYLDAYRGPEPESRDEALPSILAVAPWLSYMRALTGTREIPGTKSNPLILSWVKALSVRYPALRPNIAWYVNDDTPWCGLGAAETIGNCVPGYMPPVAPLWALNWSVWGIDVDEPFQGAIAVKKRRGGGHVTEVESVFGRKIYCRGANQANMINVAEYNLSEFEWFRWPVGAAPPIGKPITRKYVAGRATEA